MPGDPIGGLSSRGTILTRWDPDGAGPLTPKLVVGGTFATAGSAGSQLVTLFDPATSQWSALGIGLRDHASAFGEVFTAVTMPNGDLVVGGRFTEAGGSPAHCVARWNGTSWSAVGTPPFVVEVAALHVLPNGDLAAAGDLGAVHLWNGAVWTPIPSSPFSNNVDTLAGTANGDLLAAGPTSTSSHQVARWSGTSWTNLGSASFDNRVQRLLELPNGDIVAAGSFATAGNPSTAGVARWTGQAWTAMGNGLNGAGLLAPNVTGLSRRSNGNLIAAGTIVHSGVMPLVDLAEWNGSSWLPFAGGRAGAASAFEWSPTAVFVTGNFTTIASTPVGHIARWNGTTWSAVDGGGTAGSVRAMTGLPNGEFVVGGNFSRLGATLAANIARWDGAAWQPLGLGTGAQVNALATMPNGDIVAGGIYSHAGGVQVDNIGRWNGTSWSALGSGTDGAVLALATMPNGDLIAAGTFNTAGGVPASRIARWDGNSWSALGTGLNYSQFAASGNCLAVLPNGTLVVGGQFDSAGGTPVNHIATWNGTSWSGLGSPLAFVVNALAVEANGNLVAGCAGFGFPSSVLRWNGSTWSQLSGNFEDIGALLALPNGALLAGGTFPWIGGTQANNLAIRNVGSFWAPFGNTDARVRAMLLRPDGEVVIGGDFTAAGGVQSALVARSRTNCPAGESLLSTTCVGPAGPLSLAATTRPFVGATFRARATGYAATAFGAAVIGFGTVNVPLSIVDPAALPGCELLVSPDVVLLAVPTAGQTTQDLALPNTPTLVGATFSHQVVQFDAPGTPAWSLSSSNGLTLVVGSL